VSGNVVRTVTRDWTGEVGADNFLHNLRVIRETTTLDTSQVSKVETDYETLTYTQSGSAATTPPVPGCTNCIATRMNVTERREFGYGQGVPGGLLRRTDYTYLHNSNSTYLNLNIVDRPTSVITYGTGTTPVAQTQNEYDVYTT
jgi:hypothetical protein